MAAKKGYPAESEAAERKAGKAEAPPKGKRKSGKNTKGKMGARGK